MKPPKSPGFPEMQRTDAALNALLAKMPTWLRKDWESEMRELAAAQRAETAARVQALSEAVRGK